MANGRKTDQQRITAQERRLKVIAYRKGGLSFRQIADQVGASLETVHGDLQRAYADLRAQEQTEAGALRTLEAARLDDLQRACWPQAMMGNLKAIRTAVSILERRARLLGLDLQPGAVLLGETSIILRWHDGSDIIDVTPPAADGAIAAAPQITDGSGEPPGAVSYRVRWSEMGQEPAGGDVEPEDGA